MSGGTPRFPLFFGSTVVLGCFVGMVGSIGAMLFTSLGVMIKPLVAEFGWGRGEISAGLSYLTIGITCGVLLTGHLVDRFGSRLVLTLSVLLSILVVFTGPLYISSLPLFYLMLILGAVAGAPTNTVAYARVVANWFDKRRGLFIGINASGMGIGFALVPLLTDRAVSAAGWRAGYFSLGLFMLLVVLPAVYFLIIDRPEDVGLQPDGREQGPAKCSGAVADGGNVLKLVQAAQTPMFWLMLFIMPSLAFVMNGTLTQIVPMLTDRGIEPATAALVASTVGFSMAFARIIFGFLLDHVFAPRLAMLVFLLAMCGIALFLYGRHPALYFLAAAFMGFGIGAEGDLMVYLVSRYYGMRHFAAIFSCIFSAYMLGTGLGPWILGSSFDTHGDYDLILKLCIGLMFLAIVLFLFFVPYDRYRTQDTLRTG